MAGPFKMKGSPMQRNFGIGSPVRKEETSIEQEAETYERMWKDSDEYKNLVAANAPIDVIAKAKAKWSGQEKKS